MELYYTDLLVKKVHDFLTKLFKIGHSATLLNYASNDNITTTSGLKNMYLDIDAHVIYCSI